MSDQVIVQQQGGNPFGEGSMATLVSLAKQFPRDEAAVQAAALSELGDDKTLAEQAYYTIPYKRWDSDANQYVVEAVEGVSIGGAMLLARHWRNCDDAGFKLTEDDEAITVMGVFIDYETLRRTARTVTVPRFARKKNGERYKLNDDRLKQAVQAGVSKAVRNAVLAQIPRGASGAVLERAKAIVAGGITQANLGERISNCIETFSQFDVDKAMLERYVGKPTSKWAAKEVAHLAGLFNALRDGHTSVDIVWGTGEGDGEPLAGTIPDDELIGTLEDGEGPASDDLLQNLRRSVVADKSRKELIEIANEKGIEFDEALSDDDLRTVIVEALAEDVVPAAT